MGVMLSIAVGLCIWVLLWGLGVKAIDGIMVTIAITAIAVAVRMLAPNLPGNRVAPDESERTGA